LLGRYAVWSTSGSSGLRSHLVHEARAVSVYRALTLARGWLPWQTAGTLARRLRRLDRTAVVVPTGVHLVSTGLAAAGRRQRPWPFNQVQVIDLALPPDELARELNAFQPAEVVSYPTGLDLLADEQVAGRLAIRPVLVACGAEHLTVATRQKVEAAFGCPLRENYGASEFPRFAWSCRLGSLHVSADWVVLEAVDADYRPVRPGERSHTALLTNLANRLQPIIRYDLGDRIVLPPERCGCGNPLPVVQVEGRQNETLWLDDPAGARTPLLPHPLLKALETVPGVRRFQIVQSGPATLTVRLEQESGADRAAVWQAAGERLRRYLARHGLAQTELLLDPGPPLRDPVSGKFRHVSSAL
jgi:phenylacetate-coenzyme A ligase PaaK-like adenylate-forming protein